MPLYAGSGKAMLVAVRRQVYLFKDEQVPAGGASVAFLLDRVTPDSGFGFSVEVKGSGNLDVRVEGADSDIDDHYTDLGWPNVAEGMATRRYDQMPKFIRVKVVHASGPLTAILTR